MNIHAHVTTRSQDCDGEYRSGYTYFLTSEEQASEFADIEFKERVISSVVSVYATQGTLEITPNRVDWHQITDEGYQSSVAEWCEDETCEGAKAWHRDLSAEAANY